MRQQLSLRKTIAQRVLEAEFHHPHTLQIFNCLSIWLCCICLLYPFESQFHFLLCCRFQQYVLLYSSLSILHLWLHSAQWALLVFHLILGQHFVVLVALIFWCAGCHGQWVKIFVYGFLYSSIFHCISVSNHISIIGTRNCITNIGKYWLSSHILT